jgi:hypothetical protein
MTTQPATRSERSDIIARCTTMIAEHCKVDPFHIISDKPRKGAALQEARALLVYHLFYQGMSYNSIARMLQRSCDQIRRMERKEAACMMGDDIKLINRLPKLPSALQITAV